MNVKIAAVGSYVPENRVTNDDLAQKIDTSDEWIRSHTGIGARHIASDKETLSYMATEAAKKVLEKTGTSVEEIDMIILSTITPDYNATPSSACLVQHNLGAVNAGAFDIKAACSGFAYGLSIGSSMIISGSCKKVIVIGAEKMSSLLNWDDRGTCVLFGDAAGAALLTPSDDSSTIVDSVMHSEGEGAEALFVKVGGSRHPYHKGVDNKEDLFLQMDGRQVYNFAVRVNVSVLMELMERNGITMDDVDWIVPHQANAKIITAAAKRLKVPKEKFFMNIEEYANSSAATIPLALSQMDAQGKLKKGDKILTVGFGAGLTYAGNYIIW